MKPRPSGCPKMPAIGYLQQRKLRRREFPLRRPDGRTGTNCLLIAKSRTEKLKYSGPFPVP